jgi:hemoglobin
MDQAMLETGVPPELRERLNKSFFQTADWMRNQPEAQKMTTFSGS